MWEGIDEDVDWVQKVLEDKYELKKRGRLGFGPNDVRKIDMLGRVIELTHEGITWQGDPRHFDLLQEYFGMDDKTKVLTKNGSEDGRGQVELRDTELSMEVCKAFRMIAARLNYMAQDNPWLQFPAKEVCRNMAKPRASNLMKIKRLVRFLKGAGGSSSCTRGRTMMRHAISQCLWTATGLETRTRGNPQAEECWRLANMASARGRRRKPLVQHRVEKPSSSRCVMVRHGGWGCRR